MSCPLAARRLRAGLLGLAVALPATALAQPCAQATSRTTLAEFAGEPIRSLDIVTHTLDLGDGVIGNVASALHVRTREATVRRQLLFAEGDSVDTLRVAESLRRLRRKRYLADVEVSGERCPGAAGVDLVVTTRDAWSTRPELRMSAGGGGGQAGSTNETGGSSSTIGLEERNLLGTGRTARVYVRSFGNRIGTGVRVSDPWFLGSRLSADVGTDSYADGGDWHAQLATREESVFDRWSVIASAARGIRRAPGADTLRRDAASLLVARRLRASDEQVTALIFGAEAENTRLRAAPGAELVGPSFAARRLAALDLGIRRRTVQYDTLTWLLPGAAIVDVPIGPEAELVTGAGWELRQDVPVLHVDGWGGRAWIPRPGALLTTDAWLSGYAIGRSWRAGTVRGAVAWQQAARRGVWSARVSAERLFAPDPDARALVLDDPTLPVLSTPQRLSQSALAASVERSVRVRAITSSWAVDAAGFAAFSLREDAAAGGSPEGIVLGVAGLGLRMVPQRAGRGSVRLDLGYPLVRSSVLPRRLYVGVTLSPWFDELRHRDGIIDW